MELNMAILRRDNGNPVAIAHFQGQTQPAAPGDGLEAMVDLADRAKLPAFHVWYADNFSWWHVTPLNALAEDLVPVETRLTERQWMELVQRCGKGGGEAPSRIGLERAAPRFERTKASDSSKTPPASNQPTNTTRSWPEHCASWLGPMIARVMRRDWKLPHGCAGRLKASSATLPSDE